MPHGQNEPTPTSAPMWMDGALMGAPFSSLLFLKLTNVANSSSFFFSFLQPMLVFYYTPHTYLDLTYLPTFKLLTYAPWFPPSPTYLPTCPPTRTYTYLPNNLFSYVFTH
jgi:hypothetical protein